MLDKNNKCFNHLYQHFEKLNTDADYRLEMQKQSDYHTAYMELLKWTNANEGEKEKYKSLTTKQLEAIKNCIVSGIGKDRAYDLIMKGDCINDIV